MKKIGCTTPYGLELENICTEQNKSLEAEGLFDDILSNVKEVKECLYPCSFIMTRFATIEYKDRTSYDEDTVWLMFDKYIKVTTSTYSYKGLELLAELGGYVGLTF